MTQTQLSPDRFRQMHRPYIGLPDCNGLHSCSETQEMFDAFKLYDALSRHSEKDVSDLVFSKSGRGVAQFKSCPVAYDANIAMLALAAAGCFVNIPISRKSNISAIANCIAFAETAQNRVISEDDKRVMEFRSLVEQWEQETLFHSSLSLIFTHPAYQRIMAMGKPALPLILSELQKKSGQWFYALRYITGSDIAAEAEAKTFSEAREAWLEWGRNNNYIS